MPRIALCGMLRIGVDSSEPNTPPLVIVNVPPVSSSSVSLPSRARVAYADDRLLDLAERQRIGVAQHRHDQAAIGRDGDADVVVLVIDDVVAVDRGIDDREALQRLDAGLDEERHEAEPRAVLLLEALLVVRAQFVDRLEVDLVEGRQHRRRRLRLDEPLGDARAQARHRHAALATLARSRRRPACGRLALAYGAAVVRPAGAVRPVSLSARCVSTSPLVMRPSRPVPAMSAGSRSCSSTSRRTDGASLSPCGFDLCRLAGRGRRHAW